MQVRTGRPRLITWCEAALSMLLLTGPTPVSTANLMVLNSTRLETRLLSVVMSVRCRQDRPEMNRIRPATKLGLHPNETGSTPVRFSRHGLSIGIALSLARMAKGFDSLMVHQITQWVSELANCLQSRQYAGLIPACVSRQRPSDGTGIRASLRN